MTEDVIRSFIGQELASNEFHEAIGDDYPLLERNLLDSLGLFQLVGFLESEFGVEVLDEELVPANFGTVRDIAELVRSKRTVSTPPS